MLQNPNDTFLNWSWHERNLLVSDGCGLIYIPPALLHFLWSSPWATVAAIASIAVGLWLSRPSRRWIAVVSMACVFCPELSVTLVGWGGGFWLTCYLDGADKRNPPPPPSEWD